ncbi:hypothetical protein [Nocardia carnea]|uniref:hypothetical protein n=1 Tax=Nocardia carnea TaxID=37328 RepID=UPI0024576589|nr:hypothetical protein [Nocardia carnea]
MARGGRSKKYPERWTACAAECESDLAAAGPAFNLNLDYAAVAEALDNAGRDSRDSLGLLAGISAAVQLQELIAGIEARAGMNESGMNE